MLYGKENKIVKFMQKAIIFAYRLLEFQLRRWLFLIQFSGSLPRHRPISLHLVNRLVSDSFIDMI